MSKRKVWVILVTGMSGSGKTTAVQALEDEGFFCIDNLPPSLATQAVDACVSGEEKRQKIALVLDARSGSQLREVPEMVDELRVSGHFVDVFFFDASDDVLVRRYSETRRRHPLAPQPGASVVESIAFERKALERIRNVATRVIDTSARRGAELKQLITEAVRQHERGESMAFTLLSFGFKYGLPVEADLVFDVRHLQNPHFVPELKPKTGLQPDVRDYVLQQADTQELIKRIDDLVRYLVPLYLREGKRYLTAAIGCTGGRHRSVAIAEALGERLRVELSKVDVAVSQRHRDIDRA
jgi:UPF0042 nucleotide-binding protein